MRNFAIKFAILSSRFQPGVSPQIFLGLTPMECLGQFKKLISAQAATYLFFGFSDEAFLAVLEHDFEVNVDGNILMFRNNKLDNAGMRRANQLLNTDEPSEHEPMFEQLSQWLFDVTRPLYKPDLSVERILEIKEEYQDYFKLYAHQHEGDTKEALQSLFSSQKAMNSFTNAMTVDALFKADAAKAIFGENSSYYQAWLRKEVFRHMITKSVKDYIISYAA